MEIQEIQNIYLHLLKSTHQSLVKSMIKSAIRYSRLRVDWLLSDQFGRMELEEERTIAHNAFISSCDILSRHMKQAREDNFWRSQIGSDRKDIGDFACLLHAVIGIQAR